MGQLREYLSRRGLSITLTRVRSTMPPIIILTIPSGLAKIDSCAGRLPTKEVCPTKKTQNSARSMIDGLSSHMLSVLVLSKV